MRFVQIINQKKFTLITVFLFLYVLINLLDGQRGLISYYEKQSIKENENSIDSKIIYPKINVLCEPQLGRRGLYPSLSNKSDKSFKSMMNFSKINFIH